MRINLLRFLDHALSHTPNTITILVIFFVEVLYFNSWFVHTSLYVHRYRLSRSQKEVELLSTLAPIFFFFGLFELPSSVFGRRWVRCLRCHRSLANDWRSVLIFSTITSRACFLVVAVRCYLYFSLAELLRPCHLVYTFGSMADSTLS